MIQTELEPLSLLHPDGEVRPGYEPRLRPDELLAAYRLMTLSRTFDERAFNLQRQGRIGTFSQVMGQEASVIGSVWAVDPERDWVVPQYRELPALLRMGYTLTRALLYHTGNPAGNEMPAGVNVMPVQIALAAQVPHAVGLAWGLSHQGSDGVVITYFGDGASSEGDVHEAMNLAGVRRAPVIFFLQNNGWAISTPVAKQTAAPSFSLRAAGYGFPGELVDGNDLFAVHDATLRAVVRARSGDGPTLIESRTYRLGPHNTSDDPTRYVDPEERAAQLALEPLARLRAYLFAGSLLDEAADERMREEIDEEVARAIAEMERHARPGSAQLFDHVYADDPPRLRRQREAARDAEASP